MAPIAGPTTDVMQVPHDQLPRGGMMERFKPVDRSSRDEIAELLASGKWVLIANLDESDESDDLRRFLDDEQVHICLDNFRCFMITNDEARAKEFEIASPATISIYVSEATPYAQWEVEEAGIVFAEDLIQFLDDQASSILYGDPFESE